MSSPLRLGPLAVLALTAALGTPARAQHQFLPFGASISAVNTPQMTTVDLGFPFPMPGGAVVTSVDVDSQGRIVEVGSVPSDPIHGTGALANDPTAAICAWWRAWNYQADPDAGVFFQTDRASVAVVSWVNVTANAFATCTFQCQLHGDGRVVMVYDRRCPQTYGLVGISPGRGVALPSQSDLGAAVQAPLLTAGLAVFEEFAGSQIADSMDLGSTALEFAPTPRTGNATAWTVTGNDGVVDRNPPFATNAPDGGGCFEPRTYTFTPDGTGGYTVAAAPSRYDPDLGAPTGSRRDDRIVVIGLDLGFAMDFPDGSQHRFVNIDPNGRIVPTGSTTFGINSPFPAAITSTGYPYFFGAWADWNPETYRSDGIWFRTDPGVSATFTWHRVVLYGETRPCTWQIKLLRGGAVEVTWLDLWGFDPDARIAIGLTDGQGTDPGALDFSALGSVAAGPVAYEIWNYPTTQGVDWQIPGQPELVALGEPRQSAQPGSYDLRIRRAGSATLGMYLLGTAPADQSLLAYGMPCTLRLAPFSADFRLADGLGGIHPLRLTVPPLPDLVGLPIRSQGLTDGAPSPTPLFLTNAILGTVGDL